MEPRAWIWSRCAACCQYNAGWLLSHGSNDSCLPATFSQYHWVCKQVVFWQKQSVRPPWQTRLPQLLRFRMRGTQILDVVLIEFPNLQNIHDGS